VSSYASGSLNLGAPILGMTSSVSLTNTPTVTSTATPRDPSPIVYVFMIISISVAAIVTMVVVTKMIRRNKRLGVEQSHMSVMVIDEKDDHMINLDKEKFTAMEFNENF
jgi:hypothetical protein